MKKPYNKLVRDGISASLTAKGLVHGITAIANDRDFEILLKKKLLEEAAEVEAAADPDEILKELADVMEVIRTLCQSLGKTLADLESLRQAKFTARGGFEKRQFLSWVDESE